MALNVTTAVIGSGCNTATATPSIAQWDVGQVLKIEGVDLPAAYQVEFSTEYTRNAIQKIGNANGVAVPNELLQRSAPITAYIVLHEGLNDREREYWITIYITPGTPPETITPDPEEQSVIDETIAALQDGVAAAQAAAESVQNMGVEAETLAAGSEASVEKTVDPETEAVTLTFGIPRGADGAPGTPGAPGTDGVTPDFRIGTVETLPATSPATATITGTKEEPVLNLGIPQGQKGDPGQSVGSVEDVQIDGNSIVNDGVAEIPIASGDTLGIVKIASDGSNGIGRWSSGNIYVNSATVAQIKTGTEGYRPIVPGKQNASVFYGLAKAAGDVTQAASDNPVGTYTDGAKAAIKDMIGATAGGIEFDDSEAYPAGSIGAEVSQQKNAIDAKQDATNYVTLSGTIVTQTGADNTMYLCGELAELTFTAPATGQTAIRFTSGTTPTVATFSGVTWLNGFDPSAIEASKTYEINILNGLGCAAWT